MRTSITSIHIDEIHRLRVDNLLKEIRSELPEEYPIFLRISLKNIFGCQQQDHY